MAWKRCGRLRRGIESDREEMNYCLGTVQFGTQYGVQGNARPDYVAVEQMLHLALDSGISLFDTASAYGDAETVLGRFAFENPSYASKMQIVSKLDSKAFSGRDSSAWSSVAVKSAEESLSRLGAKRFFAYLFHNAQYIFDSDAVAALYSVKECGLSERIGVSVYTPEEAMRALDYPQIEAIQIPYNVFDQRLDQVGFFERAMSKKVTVFARSSLLQGLAVMELERLPEHMHFAKPYLLQYHSICERYGLSPLQTAVGYVGRHPGIDYVVFGVDNETQLSEYLSMREMRLPDKVYEELTKAFIGAEEKLVNPTLWK